MWILVAVMVLAGSSYYAVIDDFSTKSSCETARAEITAKNFEFPPGSTDTGFECVEHREIEEDHEGGKHI